MHCPCLYLSSTRPFVLFPLKPIPYCQLENFALAIICLSHIMGFSVSSQSFISGKQTYTIASPEKTSLNLRSHPAIVSFLRFSLQQNAQWDVSVLTFFTFHSLILLKTVLVRVNKNHHLSKSTAWPVIPFETIKCFILPSQLYRGIIDINIV